MAVVVPRYQPGQVQQTNLPNARYSADGATPEAFGAGIGRGLGALGEVAGKIAMAERERQDTAAVMEAEAKLREQQNEMLFGETGAFRTKGKDAFGLPERVLPEFDKRRGEIASGLRGRQRELFERRTAMWQTDMQGDLLRHVARESDDYAKATTQAYIEASGQTALNYYNDPKRVDAEIARAQDAFMAGSPGLPAEAVRLGLNKIESGIRRGIVGRMMNESPLTAGEYYEANKDRFTGEDQAEIEKTLLPAQLQAEANNYANGIVQGGAVAGTEYVAYRRALESGGRADAKNPNSSALGADQFVDSTWLNMVAKTKPAWAEGKTRDEILSMRTDPAKSAEMATALDQENAGALQAAGEPPTNENLYAAHHFGAQVGVKFAQADDDTPIADIISDAQLKANPYLRGMTKGEAIANWNSRAGASSTKVASAATGEPSLSGWLAEANKIADPRVRSLTVSALRTQWTAYKEQKQEAENAVVESAWNHVLDGGSLANLPPSVMANLPAKERKSLMDFEGKRAKGDDIVTDWSAYYRARDMAVASPEQFAKVNLYSLRGKMADTEFKELVKLQGDIKGGKGDEATAGYRTVKQVVDGSLQLAGLDPTPTSEAGRQRVEAFQRKLDLQVRQFKADNGGKEPSTEQVQKMADGLLIHGELDGSGFFSDREVFAFERAGGADNFIPDNMPQADIARVVQEIKGSRTFKASGAAEPSRQQVIDTWLFMKQQGML